ncbi:hypothetical protein [Streptomyces sp. NPDC101776]|uniref:hypothetical protein n=1 Tax=Streptomyces sp. NPDC101776 TaxID=3366146 RepID=UPI00381966B4
MWCALDGDLAHALDIARDRDVIIQIRTREVCRDIGLVLRQESPMLDTDSVHTVLDADGTLLPEPAKHNRSVILTLPC